MSNLYPFGISPNPLKVMEALKKYKAIWIEGKGWKVPGDINLSELNLKFLPTFWEVSGYFYCHNNQLTSLEGAPRKVSGYFSCVNNQLTSLEGAPKEVSGHFYCDNNQLTSLEGAPKEVSGDFYCNNNQLTSLEGAPKEVSGDFYCNNNQLTSLEGIGNVKGKVYK